jgi:hypothetical protein
MPLASLKFRPGINREMTPYTNEGGWIDGNKIRFRAGLPETIGGWVRSTASPFLGICRSLVNWNTLTGSSLLGLGTHLKYYIERGGVLFDITPIRLVSDPGDVTFAASDGSDVLVVTHTAHGARINDFVTFSGAVSLGGNVTATILNAEHQITDIIDVDSYEITLSVTADASDAGNGGASVVGTYQINTGLAVSFRGDGWGAGPWGAGGWGLPADTSIPGEQLRLWSQTTYGQNLIINPRGGGLYYWDLSLGFSGNRAVDISTLPGANEVPLQCNIVRLSEQDRHVLAFGCTPLFGGDIDPLLIRFSSQENFLEWEPSPTNTAGDLRISSGNQIVAVGQTSQQLLVLTDTSAHVIQFVGPPFTFGMREVASGISTAGPNCAVAANDMIFWMGLGEFYIYDGTVRTIPCSIREYVFEQTFDTTRRDLVFAGHNASFSEIWWFYPCTVSGECTRYAVYNYEQQIWYYGTLPRSAWIDRGVSLRPQAAGLDGYIYEQESGLNDGSENPPRAINAFAQSSPVDLGEGDQFMFVTRVIPDVTFRSSTDDPQVTITLTAQNFPGGEYFGDQPSPVVRSVELPVEQYTRQNFVRLRGRAMALRIASNKVGTAWRLGSPRVEARTDGRR